MISPFMCLILAFVPAGFLSVVFEIMNRFGRGRGSRVPISDKLLRPPGESCRRKIAEIDDKLAKFSIWIIGFPSTLLLFYLYNTGTSNAGTLSIVWTVIFALAALVVAGLIWMMLGLIRERRNWRLGFSGERAVAEQLNQLMCEGCRVFHDFPLGEQGNIDHIVVAPTGVFAIETKTKRKNNASQTQQAHEVIYDGQSLEYPFYKDTRDLDQTRSQARRLEKFLNPNFKEPIGVQPVLALPGWFVISRALGDVIVLNPKMIDMAILSPSGTNLSPERIKDISRLLDQKCRDMEF